MIGVTGATGVVGGRLAARLADLGVAQRLVVRDPSRAPRLAGARVRQASNYGAADEMRRALEGVDTLFLIPASESEDRVQQHHSAVGAAAAAGVRRIVYLSFLRAAPDATFTLARHHWATEQRIRATGLPFTFLRASLYLDFIPSMVQPDGVIAGPADDGHVAPVLRDDIAAAAAAVLTQTGHDGHTYDLTGRERFTLATAAAEMSRLTGKPVTFRDETLAEAHASRAHYAVPAWQLEAWITSYTAIAAGDLDLVTNTVYDLTGRNPTTLSEYLHRHPGALGHVAGSGAA